MQHTFTVVHNKLNLAVQDAMKNNTEMRNVLNLIKDLIAFIRGSPKWLGLANSMRVMVSVMEIHFDHFAQQLVGQ